jgi:hypothetical protein
MLKNKERVEKVGEFVSTTSRNNLNQWDTRHSWKVIEACAIYKRVR